MRTRIAGLILGAARGALLHWVMTSRIGPDTEAAIRKAWPLILGALASGELVRDTLRGAGFTADHLRAYKAMNPQARAEWDEAREQSADAFMDDALEVAYNSKLDPAHARMRVDTLKWAARIRNPRLYGDRAALDVNVRTIDLTRIIEAANARLAAQRVGQVVDAQVISAGVAQLEDLL